MNFVGILLTGVALAASTAASAQLLGGGGGIGGGMMGGTQGVAGGAQGMAGGVRGMAGGTLSGNGSLRGGDTLRGMTRVERLEARQLRADRRDAARAARAAKATSATGPATTASSGLAASGSKTITVDRFGQTVTESGALAASVSRSVTLDGDGRSVGSAGSGAGQANGALGIERGPFPRLDARAIALRREAAVSARGLRRAGRSASGVAVFLPATAIGIAPVFVGGGAYPVYSGGYAYGGSTVFVAGGEAPGYMDRQYRDLQDDVAGSGVTVERRGEDVVLQLPADVTFAFDRADIQPRFVRALDAVARTIAEYDGTEVEIVGHTDSVGSDAYNYALSQRRGVSVADFLVDRAAEPDRLIVAAMGETAPVDTNATIAGRAANRRVEIILHPRTS